MKESIKDLLTDLLEYMESRADADIMGANKEMRFQMRIEETLLNAIEDRWIPVERELPEPYKTVLFFLKADGKNGLIKDVIVNDCTRSYRKDNKPELKDGRATHWMPLPTPPKG